MRPAPFLSFSRMTAVSIAILTVLITGCGVGAVDSTSSSTPAVLTFTGNVIGGENPIDGAAVSFYETSATGSPFILARAGYYAPATPLTPLGTVYSGSDGGFFFSTPLACAHNTDYVYATAYGGNSGANAFNANILLVAAVGTCANFGASTHVNINEVTTVAAAYALAGFSSLSGTTLSVTSSATNYATVSTTTPSAAGVAHAFANAANLVNVNTGVANTSLPSNPNAIVPASIIYALANSIQACVNSSGGGVSSGVSDGTVCGNLFFDTTSNYIVSGTTTTVTPTNTFGALLNIVRYPTVNVASIYNLGTGTASAFQPAISVAPATWALAIAYPKYDGATNGITNSSSTNGLYYPVHLALDASDNVYVLNSNGATPTQSNIVAFSSSGTPLYATSVDTTTNVIPRQVATDALGHLFMVSDSGVTEFNASTGSSIQHFTLGVTTGLQSIAIDGLNDFFVGAAETSTASTQNLYEDTCGSTCSNTTPTFTAVTLSPTPTAGSVAGYTPTQLFIDPSKDIWASNYNASAVGTPFQLDYQTATSGYTAAEKTGTMPTGTTYYGNYGVVYASSGKGWVESVNEICKMNGSAPSCGGYEYDALPNVSMRELAIDGNNVLWGVDNYNGTIHSYQTTTSSSPNSSNFYTFTPCVSITATACTSSSLSGPIVSQVDSTGSVWVTSGGNGGVLQFIGIATPTWPALSYLKPGVMP